MEDIKNDKRDRLMTALLDLTPEQLAEFYRWRKVQRDFAYEMDLRFVKKQIEGLHGWENHSGSFIDDVDDEVDIDAANWCMISWFNRNKEKPKADEAAIEEHFELNFPTIGSNLYKITKDGDGEYFITHKVFIETHSARSITQLSNRVSDIGIARGFIPHGMRLANINPWKDEQDIVEIWY